MAEVFYVYILATRKDGPLYVGVTSDLNRRVFEHKTHAMPGFTARYNVDRLVYFELFENPVTAIAREKQPKKWRRAWKVGLIERDTPEWRDLAEEFVP
ncbi:GIY-YIG nuclease family protein [Microvirga sp. Mcv34]|uniref:GIY-YIG nuclease family protein n=1 Tax=Microvirga sp. Mcv34 TaxID=2926016 RepID=UPI0021CAB6E5|nr:GIY-YIG nuclease family protein [Microvirga sp. Mcv34]